MDWIQIISAVGIGALVTKVLDIAWLQKAVRDAEKTKWLREQRLRVYSKLAKEILSMGKNLNTREDAFLGYAFAAEAMLLVKNNKLANDIEHFFTILSNIFKEAKKLESDPTKKSEEHLEEAYKIVIEESRRLIIELRKSLHDKT